MAHIYLYIALGISTASALLHYFAGGLEFSRPLRRNTNIPLKDRATLWMCWHMVSVTLAVIPGLIFWGFWTGSADAIWAALIVNTAIGIAAFASNIVLRVGFGILFQGWLFVPVTVCLWLHL